VKVSEQKVFVVETKGEEDLDDPLKLHRLKQWCDDVNKVQTDTVYDYLFVDQENFEKYKPVSFSQLDSMFLKYRSNVPG